MHSLRLELYSRNAICMVLMAVVPVQHHCIKLHLALGSQAQVARYGNNNKDATSPFFVYVGLLQSGSARTSPGTGILRGDRWSIEVVQRSNFGATVTLSAGGD